MTQEIPPEEEDQEHLRFPSSLLHDVLIAYHRFLREQGAAASALSRWTAVTRRSLDFAWLGGELDEELLMIDGVPLKIDQDSPLLDPVGKMHTTAALNPYEREVLYGYPFVVGRRGGKNIRGPVLTLPVALTPDRDGYLVSGQEDFLRFNALPFRSGEGFEALDFAISKLLEQPTPWPLGLDGLKDFSQVLTRTFREVQVDAELDGKLVGPPEEPKEGEFLRLIDQAAIFVAPRSNYFSRQTSWRCRRSRQIRTTLSSLSSTVGVMNLAPSSPTSSWTGLA